MSDRIEGPISDRVEFEGPDIAKTYLIVFQDVDLLGPSRALAYPLLYKRDIWEWWIDFEKGEVLDTSQEEIPFTNVFENTMIANMPDVIKPIGIIEKK